MLTKNSNTEKRRKKTGENGNGYFITEECKTYFVTVKPCLVPNLVEKAASYGIELPDIRFVLTYRQLTGDQRKFGSHRLYIYQGFNYCETLKMIIGIPIDVEGANLTEEQMKDVAEAKLLNEFITTAEAPSTILSAYYEMHGQEFFDCDEAYAEWLLEQGLNEYELEEMKIIDLQMRVTFGEGKVETGYVYETATGEKGEFNGTTITTDMDTDELFNIARRNYVAYDGTYQIAFGKSPEVCTLEKYVADVIEYFSGNTVTAKAN